MAEEHLDTATGMAMEGIATFMGVAYLKPDAKGLRAEKVRAAFMGVPYEGGSISNIFRPGTSMGPRAVRRSSTHLTHYNWELDVDIVSHYNLRDCGDIPVAHTDSAKTRDLIERYTGMILDAGALPVLVGGDHSIPVPAGKALSTRTKGKMGLLSLDSHLDASEDMYGDRYTHCSLAPRFLEFPNVDPKNIVIVGHHGNSIRPTEVKWLENLGIHVFFQNHIWDRGIEAVMEEALDLAWDGVENVYVTFDTDIVDAAYMPGVCSSEPGGVTSREILKAARIIGARGINQIDICELAPAWDNQEISARLVISFIINILAANAWHEKSGLPMGRSCLKKG